MMNLPYLFLLNSATWAETTGADHMTVKQRENQSINSNSKELYAYQKQLPRMHTSAHVYTHAISLTINSNIAFDLPASIWKICKTKTGQFSFWFSQLRSLTKRTEKSNGN